MQEKTNRKEQENEKQFLGERVAPYHLPTIKQHCIFSNVQFCPIGNSGIWKNQNGEYYRSQEFLEGILEGETVFEILSKQTIQASVLQEIALCEACKQDNAKQMLKKVLETI